MPGMAMADLFYVIGASGSGKDSLIRYARMHISSDAQVVFTHRYITRAADAGGENHVALDEKEFLSRDRMQCFAMSWCSHNLRYGIGVEINQWLERDLNVVVNGSRGYLQQAARDYPELRPILISVEPEILRNRLQQRGREDSVQIEHRLIQARELEAAVRHPGLVKIQNNGALEDAGSRFIDVIQCVNKQQCA